MSDVDELPRDSYLTLREAARHIGMDEAFLRDLVRRGEGPAVARVNEGKLALVSESALPAWTKLWFTRMALGLPTHHRPASQRPLMTAARKPAPARGHVAAPQSLKGR